MSAAAAEFLKPTDRKRQRRTKGPSEAESVIRFALGEPPQTFGRQFVSDHERPLRADCVEKLENLGLRKSRKCRMWANSAAARLSKIDTSASGRFCGD